MFLMKKVKRQIFFDEKGKEANTSLRRIIRKSENKL